MCWDYVYLVVMNCELKENLNAIRNIFFSLTMTLTNENSHAKYLNSQQQTNKPANERRKKQLNSVANFDMENMELEK